MEGIEIESRRFPIGKFSAPSSYSTEDIKKWIHSIDHLPGALRNTISGLNDNQLDTPYREGGWTIRQVVHHLVDSHINSYCRFKLAMTEETPVIKPYYEDRWAELKDSRNAPVELSLSLLEALHSRWIYFLRTFTDDDWKRDFYHPESQKKQELYKVLALYAWHGNHHLAHITGLKQRMKW
ncbi:MAG: bacillithiol transferase BstA [Bacteroidia bacterium]|nr:bacillithiol transferase BstA [Bacteroidia bacterium]